MKCSTVTNCRQKQPSREQNDYKRTKHRKVKADKVGDDVGCVSRGRLLSSRAI